MLSGNNAVSENKKELKPQGDLVFALDIGTRTVVGIIGEYIDEKFRLKDYISVPHTKRAMVDGQVEDIKQVAKIVAQAKAVLEERNGVELKRVSIAAAGRALKTCRGKMEFDISSDEYITSDMIKSMEIETIQKAQAELDSPKTGRNLFYCVGHSIMQYRLDDYKILSLKGHKGEKVEIELIAAFLPGIVVEGLYAVMDLNELEVESLTLEPIAAMNVIVPPEIRLINIALVDIGAGTSDIAIAKDGSVVAYAMATTAGDEITEEIIRTYLVDFNTAEALKQSCSQGEKELEYRDILGIPHKVKAEDIVKMLTPAVDSLAETICSSIMSANGGSPAAVFLVGGGSLIEGLPRLVAEKLSLDESRVAIGGGDFLKNVDENGAVLGAEYVTPLGIAVTSILDEGYDFSVISVNDKKVRVFDTKQLSVYEALTIAGYRSAEIMGRSGRNLTFTLNGTRRTIKGEGMTPAEIKVNDKPASIMTKVTQGDRISLVPAASGLNASARLSDEVSFGKGSGKVYFCGEEYKIGIKAYVNGKEEAPDYDIRPLDNIETIGIVTIDDLLCDVGASYDSADYRVNGVHVEEGYVLSDGDRIAAYDSYGNLIGKENPPIEEEKETKEQPETPEAVTEAAEERETAETAKAEEKGETAETAEASHVTEGITDNEISEIAESFAFEEAEVTVTAPEPVSEEKNTPEEVKKSFSPVEKGISVVLNGDIIGLPDKNGENMLFDLLNYIEIDTTRPGSELILLKNGAPAKFSTPIADGDRIVIRVENRLE